MAYRRRRSFRRSSRMRWFTPNLWNGSYPQTYSTLVVPGGSTGEVTSETNLTNVLYGSAPFPGVNNAAGVRAGTMLAERQYFNIRRIVGRMNWYIVVNELSTERTFVQGGMVTVWWALMRMPTDENGVPYEAPGDIFPSLATRDNQDDKKLILAQDVWRTPVPKATVWQTGDWHFLSAEPPLYSLIDKTMKRSFRNEQDIFLATQFGVCDFQNAWVTNDEFALTGLHNLRCLGTFGR